MKLFRVGALAIAWVVLTGHGVAAQSAATETGEAARDPAAIAAEADAARIGRATLLALHLEPMRMRSWMQPWQIGVGITIGAASLGSALFVEDLSARAAFATSGAILIGGGIASFLVPDEYTAPLVFSTAYAGLGALAILAGLEHDEPHVGGYALSLGLGVSTSSALMLVSMAIRGEVPASVLARDYQRLRSPALRARLSEAEIAAIEDRYRRNAPAIDTRIIIAPTLIGNAVAAGLLLDRADEDPEAGYAAVALLSAGVVLPLLVLLIPTGHALYEQQLERAGIALQLAPTLGGAQVTGTF